MASSESRPGVAPDTLQGIGPCPPQETTQPEKSAVLTLRNPTLEVGTAVILLSQMRKTEAQRG